MALVIDASFTIAAVLEERPADTAPIEAVIAAQGAVAPPLWRLEVANSLLTAIRRKRLIVDRVPAILSGLGELPVTIDAASAGMAWTAAFQLAIRHGLTIYDASYLELAIRRSLGLATFDKALGLAAQKEGVAVSGT